MKKIGETLLMIAILMLSLNYLLYHCFVNYELKSTMRIISLILIIFSIALNKNTKISFAFSILILYSIIGIILKSEMHVNLLFLLLIIYSMQINMNDNNVIKKLFHIALIVAIIYIILYFLGILSNTVTYYGGRIRNSLGFDNVNALSPVLASFIFLFTMNAKKHNFIVSVLCIALTIYVSSLTDSRTMLYTTIIFFTLSIIFNMKVAQKYIYKIFNNKLLTNSISLLLFASPLILMVLYNKIPSLDVYLSGRGKYLYNFLSSQNIINYIFGYTTAEFIDNSFIIIFFSLGIIWYLVLMYVVSSYLSNKRNMKQIPFILSMLFFGTMESILVRPECIITIYFWYLLFNENVKNLNKNDLYNKEKVVQNE